MANKEMQKRNTSPVFINERTFSEILAGSNLDKPQVTFRPDGTIGMNYSNLGEGYNPSPVISRDMGKEIGSVPHIQHLLTEEGKAEELLNLQALNSLVSKNAAKSFDKSAYAAYPFKLLGYAAKGAADFGVSVVDAARTAGDDMSAIINNQAFHNMVDNLDANDVDKKHAQAIVGYLQAAGYSRAEVANFNIDNPFDKNGNQMRPLSDKAKDIFKLYQEHLKSQEKLEYNRIAKSFYQEDMANNYWAIKGYNKGDETLQMVGEFIGQGAASSAVFGLAGSAASLGLAEAATAGRLLKKGIDLGSAAAKTGGITTAGRVAAMLGTRNANLATFALNNFGKLQAVASIAGGSGVFSLSGDMAYREARDLALSKGYSFDDANAIGVFAGVVGGGIETFFNMKYTSRFITEKSPTFWNIAMIEAVPEGLQEATSEAASKAIYNFTGLEKSSFADIAGDMLVAFCGGMMGGFAFGLSGRADINAEARVAGLANYEAEQRKQGTFVPPTDTTVPVPPAADVTEEQLQGQEAVEKIEISSEPTTEEPVKTENKKTLKEHLKEGGFYKQPINLKDIKFSEAQEHILTSMKEEYISRAKKNNPKITKQQLENGWKIVVNMMKHEINTGEFTKTLDTNINALISSIDTTDERVKANLQKLNKKYGGLKDLNVTTDFYYSKLLSKKRKERYDAQWNIAMKQIEDEFALNGSREQGRLIANTFKNRAYILGLYFKGTPLELYQRIKPQIINLSRARMNQQPINAAHSLLDDFKDKEYIQSTANQRQTTSAKTKAVDVYNKMLNLPFVQDSEEKKATIEEISVELFGFSDTLKTEEDVEEVLNAVRYRAEKEYSVMSEMGILDGNSHLTPDDFNVIGLLREQGYPFEFIIKPMGIKVTNARNRDMDTEYKEAVEILFPPLSRSELKALNNLNPETRKQRTFRAGKQGDIYFSEAQKRSTEELYAMDNEEVDEMGEPLTSGVEPNALYSRKDVMDEYGVQEVQKTIVVKDQVSQGELAHEGGHFLFVEMLLKTDELSTELGVELVGSVREIFDIIEQNIKKSGKRLSTVNKQETLLDAVVKLYRDGTTGDPKLNQLLASMQSELSNKILSPEGSVLEEMSDKELDNVGKAVKAFLSPSEPIAIIESLEELDANLGNLETDGMVEQLIGLMQKFNYPFVAPYRTQLELLLLDGPENVSKYHLMLLADGFVADAKAFAIEGLISTEIKYKDKTRPTVKGEDVDMYYFQKSPTVTKGEQHFEKVGKEIRPDTERPFGASTSVYQDVKSLPAKFKKLYYDTMQAITPMFYSMTDVFGKVSNKLSAALQNAQWERDKMYRAKIQPAIDLKNLIDEHNKKYASNDPHFISFKDQIDFMDALRNKDTSKALNVFLGKMDTVTQEKAQNLFNQALEGLKEMRIRLERVGVTPAAGWIEDGQYWPFMCIKFEDLCHYLDTHPDNQLARIARQEKEKALSEGIKDKKKIQMRILDAINGVAYGRNEEARVAAFHSRSTKLVDKALFKFYADPFEAYIKYMADATTTVMNRTLFGKVNTNTNFSGGLFAKILSEEGLLDQTERLSKMTSEEIARLPEEERKIGALVETVKDYMQRNSTPEAWRKLNDVINMMTIGQVSSAIGQGMELALTSTLYGIANTAKGVALAKSGKGLTLEDLHISDINETFRESSRGMLNAAANFTLTASLFKASDKFLKLATINAIHAWIGETLQKSDAKSYDFIKLMQRLDEAFDGLPQGDTRKGAVTEAILNKEMTDDVKYFVASLFAKQQPINSISIQSKYNSMSPLGKLCVYKLNTVTGKQMIAMIEEVRNRLNNGDWGDVLKLLLKHIVYSIVVGVPVNIMQSLVNLRDPKIASAMVLSPMQIFGVNSYTVHKVNTEGVGSAFADRFTPPLAWANDIFTPAINMVKGKDIDKIGFDKWVKIMTTTTGYSGFFAGLMRAANDVEGSFDFEAAEAAENMVDDVIDSMEGLVFK